MTRKAFLRALPLVAYAACAPGTATYVGFSTGIEGAPPPPPAVLVEPPPVAVAEGDVYVVTDPAVPYDMFRFGATWYVYHDNYWYQSTSYRGPFTVVDVRYVPREVVTLPPGHWKHHPHGGPPGLVKRGRDRGEG